MGTEARQLSPQIDPSRADASQADSTQVSPKVPDSHRAGRNRTRSQKGETLMESLLAIMLLAMVAVPAFAGIQVALKASAMHHEIALSETLLRSAAEELQNPDAAYIPLAGCPGHGIYSGLPQRERFSPIAVSVQFWLPAPPPAGPSQMALKAADSHDLEEFGFDAPGTCPAEDPGLQKIRLRVSTPSGHIQTLDILKREP